MTASKADSELKPCPHCGHAAMWVDGVAAGVAIVCGGTPRCRASVGLYGGGCFDTEAKAIAAWNTRAQSPATMEAVAWQERMKSPSPEIDREWFEIDQADFEQHPAQYDYRALYTHPAPAAPTLEADGLAEPLEMLLIRGPLSQRATSAEFNEWQAREIAVYVDQLREQARHYPTVAGENMRLRERLATVERERDEARADAATFNREAEQNYRSAEASEAKVLALSKRFDAQCDHSIGLQKIVEALSGKRPLEPEWEKDAPFHYAIAHAALEQAKSAAALSPDKEGWPSRIADYPEDFDPRD